MVRQLRDQLYRLVKRYSLLCNLRMLAWPRKLLRSSASCTSVVLMLSYYASYIAHD